MPNIKSAKKRVKVIKVKSLKNSIRKSVLKTNIKKFVEALNNNDANLQEIFKNATKAIDKSAVKKIIHKNAAARKKSRLQKKLNKAIAGK